MRKRSQLVRHRTTHVLSIQNHYNRNLGTQLKANDFRRSDRYMGEIEQHDVLLAIQSSHHVIWALDEQIKRIEKRVRGQIRLSPEYEYLLTVDGIGDILGLTIMLETGDIKRFRKVGNYASYCRCVNSEYRSNDKKKGEGNGKNGNKYLSWAFIEAANFAKRHNQKAKRFYQRKAAKNNDVVVIKALAHKLARACYYIIRDQVPFDENKVFA